MLQVKLLGQFEVAYGDERLSVPTRNAQALLAYLMLTPGQSHRRELLAGLLWPDSAEENARSNLRHELWRLRKALEKTRHEYLVVNDLSLAFDSSSPFSLDARTLEAVGPNSSQIEDLIAAVIVYQGDLLPGFYDEWVFSERDRLRAAYEIRMARLLHLLQAERRWDDVQVWATRWISSVSWPEPAYRALILSYAQSGDLPRAMMTYDRLRQGLERELGVQPSDQTQALYERLRSGTLVTTSSASPPVGLGMPQPVIAEFPAYKIHTNLPRPLTSFIGRRTEIAQVKALVDEARLVTIVGTGGVGKTRLAIEVGAEVSADFPDGVWWVELAPLGESPTTPIGSEETSVPGQDLVWQAIAKATNVTQSLDGTVAADVLGHLRNGRRLLILDNCEHVIVASATIAEQLLAGASGLKVLSTSRESLGVAGEKLWSLAPLSLPEEDDHTATQTIVEAEAVQLFLQRAADVRTDFAPTEVDLRAIAQLCKQLDGIPLAIELAAARLSLLSPTEIAVRLDSRFSLLTAGQRTALPRHQTLRAAIEWSYDLLSDAEKVLFRRLSVFAGSFTLQAAEAICSDDDLPAADILTLMARLKDKSLIHFDPNLYDVASGTRYRLLDTICSFGLLMLAEAGEIQTLRNRHADYHAELVESVAPRLFLQEQIPWSRVLQLEYDNIRAAIEWSIESDQADYGLRMVDALTWFWFSFLSIREGHDLAVRILKLPSAAEPTVHRARMANALAFLQWHLSEQSISLAILDGNLEILRAADDMAAVAWGTQLRGLVLGAEGKYELAERAMREGVEIARQLGDPQASSLALPFWGDIVLNKGDRQRAIAVYLECATLLKSLGNENFAAYSVRRLGYLALEDDDLSQAWQLFRESLASNHRVGDRRGEIACYVSVAALALSVRELAAAARLFGLVEQNLALFSNLLPLDQKEFSRVRDQLHEVFEERDLATAVGQGQVMSVSKAAELVETTFTSHPLLNITTT